MKPILRPPNWLFTIALTIFAAQLFGQNIKNSKPVYRYALKAYLNVFYDNHPESQTDFLGRITTTERNQSQISPVIGISRQMKKGVFREISLTHLNFAHYEKRNDYFRYIDSVGNLLPTPVFFASGEKTWTNHVGLRFEWDFPLSRNEKGYIHSFIGVSTDPSVFYEKNIPYGTAFFPTRFIRAENTFSIIPRINLDISSRLFLDIHCPISVFSLASTYRYENNPILPLYAREKFDFSAKLFPPVFNFRVGVGYKI